MKPSILVPLSILALAVVLGLPALSLAVSKKACLTGAPEFAGGDAEQIRALRAEIDAACACASFDGEKGRKHGDYRACVRPEVQRAVDEARLRPQCKGTVKAIYGKSTCGRAPERAFVACIRKQEKRGTLSCAIKPSRKRNGAAAESCASKAGRFTEAACPGFTHCIDAADTNGDLLISAPGDSGGCKALPTPEPTATATPTPSAAPPTATPEPTATPSPEPTSSPTPRPTETPLPTASPSPTPEPTASPTPTPSPDLPPDPGEAGKATLEGIDSDGDGLRDDLQRYIALTYPDDPQMRLAVRQLALSYQLILTEGDDPAAATANTPVALRAAFCLGDVADEDASFVLDNLRAQAVNTRERFEAWVAHNENTEYDYPGCLGLECEAWDCDFPQ